MTGSGAQPGFSRHSGAGQDILEIIESSFLPSRFSAIPLTRRRSLRHLHPFSSNNTGIIEAITGRMCTVMISYLSSCIVCCRRLYPHQSRAMPCTSASPFCIAVLISAMSFHSVRYAIANLRHTSAAPLIYIPQVMYLRRRYILAPYPRSTMREVAVSLRVVQTLT